MALKPQVMKLKVFQDQLKPPRPPSNGRVKRFALQDMGPNNANCDGNDNIKNTMSTKPNKIDLPRKIYSRSQLFKSFHKWLKMVGINRESRSSGNNSLNFESYGGTNSGGITTPVKSPSNITSRFNQEIKVNENDELCTPSRLKYVKEESPRKRQRPTSHPPAADKSPVPIVVPIVGSNTLRRRSTPIVTQTKTPTKTPTKMKSKMKESPQKSLNHSQTPPIAVCDDQNSHVYNEATKTEGQQSDHEVIKVLVGALKAMMVNHEQNSIHDVSQVKTTISKNSDGPSEEAQEKQDQESIKGDLKEREAIKVLASNKQLAKTFPNAMRALLAPQPSTGPSPVVRKGSREDCRSEMSSPICALPPNSVSPVTRRDSKAERNAKKLYERVKGIQIGDLNDYHLSTSNQSNLHLEYLDLIGGLRSSRNNDCPQSLPRNSSTLHRTQPGIVDEGVKLGKLDDEVNPQVVAEEWTCEFCLNFNQARTNCLLCGKCQGSVFESSSTF